MDVVKLASPALMNLGDQKRSEVLRDASLSGFSRERTSPSELVSYPKTSPDPQQLSISVPIEQISPFAYLHPF